MYAWKIRMIDIQDFPWSAVSFNRWTRYSILAETEQEARKLFKDKFHWPDAETPYCEVTYRHYSGSKPSGTKLSY